MTHDPPVVRRQVEITNALGFHLRPAQKFVTLADRFACEIRVVHKGRIIDGRSILGLATMAAECGSRLELEASGPDAEAALSALAELISAEFHEDHNGDPLDGLRAPNPNHPGGPPPTPPAAPEAAP
jgi:phosphocarrier protein